MRSADDHAILRNDRSRVQSDFAGDEIDFLTIVLLQINDTIFYETRHRRSRLRIQRDEAISPAWTYRTRSFTAVGPVGESASRQLPRRILTTRAPSRSL